MNIGFQSHPTKTRHNRQIVIREFAILPALHQLHMDLWGLLRRKLHNAKRNRTFRDAAKQGHKGDASVAVRATPTFVLSFQGAGRENVDLQERLRVETVKATTEAAEAAATSAMVVKTGIFDRRVPYSTARRCGIGS